MLVWLDFSILLNSHSMPCERHLSKKNQAFGLLKGKQVKVKEEKRKREIITSSRNKKHIITHGNENRNI